MDNYSIKEVELLMNTDVNRGLNKIEAMKRLKQDGYNEINEGKKKTIGRIFEQFKDQWSLFCLWEHFFH